MKMHISTLLSIFFGTLAASGQVVPISGQFGTAMTSTATITLRPTIYFIDIAYNPQPPQPPFTLIRGTHLQIVAPTTGITHPVVTWYKNNQRLAATGGTLDIPAVSPSDTGTYSAEVHAQDNSSNGPALEPASVLVTNAGQRLTNLSTRARIDASQPFFLTGFVVESGPKQTMVLVRAVGPTLATLGVSDPLAAPQLRVLDSLGHDCTPLQPTPPGTFLSVYPTTDAAAARVGAFPLPAGSKDVAQLYLLGPGSYVAQASSTDGATGTTLVEVYEVPL